jgi:beta-glucosidase
MTARTFPAGFIWGTATAAHQVEGNNVNSDCWALEQARPSFFREPSGDAIDQYHRFGDDAAILAGLGLNAYRFSIEWARIEPEQGQFSKAALDHYQRCIDACLARGVAPMLTFQHFTLPLWQAKRGGFNDAEFADNFARYCEHAAKALHGFHMACTINELNLPLYARPQLMARQGTPNGAKRLEAAEAAIGSADNFFLFTRPEELRTNGVAAHRKGYDAIKAAHPTCKVGVTLAVQDEQAEPGAEALRDQRRHDFYAACLEGAKGDDFVGVQTYTRVTARRDGTVSPEPGHRLTAMGYEDRPQAMAETCRFVWEAIRTPIIITENGWSGERDSRRADFIREALADVHQAIGEGVDIRGYIYWSAFDNYGWMAGYRPKFGLIGVDRATQTRQIKGSALALGAIARANALDAREPDELKIDAANPDGF